MVLTPDHPRPPVALTIAGSDSGGGAGIVADLKTFEAHGVWGTCALVAVTAQNTLGVQAFDTLSPDLVAQQIRSVAGDLGVEIVRVEQLYPFPSEPLARRLKAMPNLEHVVWAQEEARNNGAWFFVEPLIEACLTEAGKSGMRPIYAGRASSASPATGLAKRHAAEQEALIAQALGHSSRDDDTAVAAE